MNDNAAPTSVAIENIYKKNGVLIVRTEKFVRI